MASHPASPDPGPPLPATRPSLAPAPSPLAGPAALSDRFRWLLVVLFRVGLVFAGGLLVSGLALYFVREAPLPLATGIRGGGLAGTLAVAAAGEPLTLLTFGLFVLLSLPVARVGLSVVHFARVRDRLYLGLTATVLALLLVGVLLGRAL